MDNPKFIITKENQEKLSFDEVKFVFEQAEKQLKQSVDISNTVVTRTAILLTVAIGILTSIIGFLLKQYIDTKPFGLVEIISACLSVYLFIWVLFTALNIKGHDYRDIGSEPITLIHNHFIETYPDNKSNIRTVYYYLSQINDYQERIEKNKTTNNKRWLQFRISLWGIIIPFVVLALYALIKYLLFIYSCGV